ncbi:MAG: serine hydrolase domain-containing protein [Acidobacteriaceae bacterium]
MNASEAQAEFPDADRARRFSLPQGWTLIDSEPAPTILGPEGDIRIAFVELEADGTPSQIALAAWRAMQPDFNLELANEASAPAEDGWEQTTQIVYAAPARESRLAIAIVRTMGSRAYVNLIDGSKAAVSRRGANVVEALRSWRPEGLKETSLNDRGAKQWGPEQSRQLKDFALMAMAELQVPGVSIAVVQNGEVVYAEGLGVRAIGDPAPVTAKTRFMIGSTTKPLTTLMTAKLVDQGKLSWSTSVADLLPGFQLADPQVTQRLEMRHTASASTGMPRQDYEFLFQYSGITPEMRMAQMKTMQPTTGFGETFQYSNFLVAAGGYAAARAFSAKGTLEEAFENAMAALVLTPLGMGDTFLRQPDALAGDAALPHATDYEGKSRPLPLHMEMACYSVAPAGGMWSTAPDLCRYLLLELGNGRMSDGEKIISEDALLERRQKGVKIDNRSSYGLGLFISDDCGLRVIHHGGNTLGFSSDMYFLPEKDLGVAVLTNLYGAIQFLAALRRKILEIVLEADQKAEGLVRSAAAEKTKQIERLHAKVTTDPASVAWIEHLVGTYRCEELGAAEVAKNGEHYWIQFDEWGSTLGSEIEPSGDRVLRLLSPPWGGGLKLLVNGEKELVLDAGQMKYSFRR